MVSSEAVNEPFAGRSSFRRNPLRWPTRVVLAAAILSLLIVGTGMTLWHQDAPGTPCSICYAAHLPALRTLPAGTPVVSDAIVWLISTNFPLNHAAPEQLNSAPRAPPV
jgi:hypothetical protein